MCMSSRQYTTAKVVGTIVSMLLKLSKSVMFNILLYILGFAMGYVLIASKVHYYATKHEDADYICQLEQKVHEMEVLDRQYTQLQIDMRSIMSRLKDKKSHEVHHECESKIGSKVFVRD